MMFKFSSYVKIMTIRNENSNYMFKKNSTTVRNDRQKKVK